MTDDPILRAISSVLYRGVVRIDLRTKLDGKEVRASIYRVDDRTPCRVDVCPAPVIVTPKPQPKGER